MNQILTDKNSDCIFIHSVNISWAPTVCQALNILALEIQQWPEQAESLSCRPLTEPTF